MNLIFKLNNSFFKCLIIIFILYITSKLIYKKIYINPYDKAINNNIINKLESLRVSDLNFFFKLTSINYCFSYKFDKVELEYYFLLFDSENRLIIPSNLSFYYNLNL